MNSSIHTELLASLVGDNLKGVSEPVFLSNEHVLSWMKVIKGKGVWSPRRWKELSVMLFGAGVTFIGPD